MSTQPISLRPKPPQSEEQKQRASRAALRSDVLYWSGVLLLSIGVSTAQTRPGRGLIVLGFFCLLNPLLELASSFLKGLSVHGLRR